MRTKYWIPSVEEFMSLHFETYKGSDCDADGGSWTGYTELEKKEKWFMPTDNPKRIAEAEAYFKISLKEDKYVLEMERKAFELFYKETKKELDNPLNTQ